MSYTLGASEIRSPNKITENNLTQFAQQKTLSGTVGRDYFGSNKRIWKLEYNNLNQTDFGVINTIYQTYLSTGTAQTWVSTEANYAIASTTVHVDLLKRGFSISGSDYLSDIEVTLTEA